MGMCLEGKGKMSVEVRRESFIVHPSYGYTKDDAEDDVCTPESDRFGARWREEPHPEFLLEDLDDLIASLEEARAHLKKTRSDVGR